MAQLSYYGVRDPALEEQIVALGGVVLHVADDPRSGFMTVYFRGDAAVAGLRAAFPDPSNVSVSADPGEDRRA